MSWEEAVRKLFQTHPRAVSSKTVIEAIKSASENTPTFTLALANVTDDTQTEMSPNAHTDNLLTRAEYRAQGRIFEREAIAQQLKALPADALFYPDNILKILKLH